MSKQLAFIYDYKEGDSARDDGTRFKWFQCFGLRPASKFEVANGSAKAGSLVPFGRDSEGKPTTKIRIPAKSRDSFPSFTNLPGWYIIESELAGTDNIIIGATELQPIKIPEVK